MKHFISAFCVLISIISISCSRDKNNPVNANGDSIISDQFDPDSTTFPGGVPRFVTLLRLKSPALLATATRGKDDSYVFDETLKKTILAEQQVLEDKLAKISPDIHILYRYRMVLNALAVEAPQSFSQDINELEDVQFIEADERFMLPKVVITPVDASTSRSLADSNSMKIIGALDVNNKLQMKDASGTLIPVLGQGVRVGIIDSGIDYTHKMFGGTGDTGVFKGIDPTKDNPLFPTAKVVGGRDFVGAAFNTGSHIYANKIPVPDNNPLDTTGHGSHVAGTVAGIGDGVAFYNGAAPGADLYALKVFGDKSGSTSDTTVIAALEYAADPNQDFDNSDRLHVVNLSLGGSYGKPHSLYNMAIGNLAHGGTLAVVSAGNDGALPNIVGSPSTANEALSVAASLDDMEQNWQFPASEFKTVNQPQIVVETVEGATTKPIRLAGNITGSLVYVGKAAVDLTPEMLAAVQGKVALIDRGDVGFDDKINRVTGAIGVVMVNNNDEPPFTMGGTGKFDIPGIMISKAVGDMLKSEMLLGDVVIQFLSLEKIKKPELIDTLASFSSQGPRANDSLIKPEITAPGYNIISAAFGSGVKAARMSGTSMSSPHVTGLAALLFQYHPNLTALEIKALLMNSSESIDDRDGVVYPISRQGAGRANVYKAAISDFVIEEASVSLGEVQMASPLKVQKSLTIKNISTQTLQIGVAGISHPNMTIQSSVPGLSLAPGQSQQINLDMTLLPIDATTSEIDGFVSLQSQSGKVATVPVMAIANHLTNISATQALAQQSSGATQVSFVNSGLNSGSAFLFQLLGEDARKPTTTDTTLSSSCDLESVGFRLIERQGVQSLQVATKLFNPVTDWNACDLNVEMDFDNDGVSDREIIGTAFEGLPGLSEENIVGFQSAFFDSKLLNSLYNDYKKAIALQPVDRPVLSYKSALMGIAPMLTYDHSTLAMVEVPTAGLAVALPATFKVRVTVSYNDGDIVEGNDALITKDGEWNSISLNPKVLVPEEVILAAGASQVVTVENATGIANWISYFPRNQFILDLTGKDNQSTIVVPSLLPTPLL